MTTEPNDVETLARLLHYANGEGIRELCPDTDPDPDPDPWSALTPSSRSVLRTSAKVLLASDWLVAHDAEVREEVALAIDRACPHAPDEHAEGTCEVCDYAFAAASIARQAPTRDAAGGAS